MTKPTSCHSPQVSVRLDPEVVAKIQQAAHQERRTVSDLLRIVISDWAAARLPAGESSQAAA